MIKQKNYWCFTIFWVCLVFFWPIIGIAQQDAEKQKCPRGGCEFAHPLEETPNLKAYITLALPEATLLELSCDLNRLNGAFIVRGLPNNSFLEFAQKVKYLREQGILTPIIIDPDSFESLEISSVPCTVLTQNDHYDKVTGNLRIEDALRLFAESGSTSSLAKEYLQLLQNGDNNEF